MADKRVTVTLECVDNATKKIEQAGKAINNLSKNCPNVSLAVISQQSFRLLMVLSQNRSCRKKPCV